MELYLFIGAIVVFWIGFTAGVYSERDYRRMSDRTPRTNDGWKSKL